MTTKKKKILIVGSFILAGMIAGLAYWRFVGCSSGTCAITSRWHTMLVFGGIIGYLIGDSFKIKTSDNIMQKDKTE
jgi:hypothetical protein